MDVLRVPSLYQVTDNAIASAMMSEALDRMVTVPHSNSVSFRLTLLCYSVLTPEKCGHIV